jgi:hypothetical protein
MSQRFFLRFGTANPQEFAGLTPTLMIFKKGDDGTDLAAPAVTEVGVSTGFYKFTYPTSPTFSIVFVADGGAAITDDSSRYVAGVLDPITNVDQELGFAADSYGSTALPTSAMGNLKRVVQYWQADATFNKSTGVWSQYAQGSSTLLYEKTLANNVSQTTKT